MENAEVIEQARILRIQIDDGELERGVDVRYEWDEAACEFKVKKVLIN